MSALKFLLIAEIVESRENTWGRVGESKKKMCPVGLCCAICVIHSKISVLMSETAESSIGKV